MKQIIDFGSELLLDRSRIASPYLQLLLVAVGRQLASGSPWVAVNKKTMLSYNFPLELLAIDARRRQVA
jgi:hypothetical protein